MKKKNRRKHYGWQTLNADVREISKKFWDDEPFQKAAAMSYYTLLSLAPLILVVIGVAGLIFGRDAVAGRLVYEIQGLIGTDGGKVIQAIVKHASEPGKGWASVIIGVGTLLFGSSTVFVQLQQALNQIWGVKSDPKRNAIWSFLRERLLSLAMVLGIGFLLLVSLVLSAALSAINALYSSFLSTSPVVLEIIHVVISVGVIAVLFAMIFKFLPDAEISWNNVWFGSLLTAVLFTLGKFLIGLYLGRVTLGSAFGAAGSIVVLMVWAYYASIILFFGAEVTEFWAKKRGTPIEPSEHAIKSKS